MSNSSRMTKNQKVRFSNGKVLTITQKLGEGGQGTVYMGVDKNTGEKYAVKCPFPDKYSDIKKHYDYIENQIRTGPPAKVFTWPLFMSEWMNGTFAYAMNLIPKDYKCLSNYIMAKVRFKNLDVMIDSCIRIVEAFRLLHNAGYSYQDLNEENLFINPNTGEIIICDTENVMGQGHYSGVRGKARYMAPEVVRGEAMPNKETDKFSMALILFMIMVGDHPLEGARTNVPCLTSKYDMRFFGKEPLFCFDKNDDSNMPREGIHNNAINIWNCIPKYIKEAFEKSFSQDSLLRAEGRLQEQEWIHLLMRLKSSITKCPICGNDVFVDCHDSYCDACGKTIIAPGYLKFKSRTGMDILVPIYQDTRLFDYHLNYDSSDYFTVKANVMAKPGKYGLLNKSGEDWQISSADGSRKSIRRNKEIAVLGSGFVFDFGNGNIAEVINN
ncbi:MAG: serine/threonine-protein kinase [Eubacterium sp.]|nr:serine/threonine-protein kinase [Eubacterium sp.]